MTKPVDPLARVEVRCCCVPTKLLGWINIPTEKVVEDAEVFFSWTEKQEVITAANSKEISFIDIERGIKLTVTKFYKTYVDGLGRLNRTSYLALKDNGAGVSDLRRCPTFIENVKDIKI